MNKALDQQEIISLVAEYAEAIVLNSKALEEGNSDEANRQADIVMNVYCKLKNDSIDAHLALLSLLTHSSEDVRSTAAAHTLEIAPDKAQPVLECIAAGDGVRAMIAYSVLEDWRNGRLKYD